jgi:F-box-like
MAWETAVTETGNHFNYVSKPQDARCQTDPTQTFQYANFSDILSSELVLICITSYLPVSALLALSSTSRQVRSVMHTTPGVWRVIDLSDLPSIPDPEKSLVKFLRNPYVARDCRHLILDGISFDHELLNSLLVREMLRIHTLSIQNCPGLNGDQLIKLIDYIRRTSAPRPLALRYISMLGAPLFPFDQPSPYAPVIVAAAGQEILTDLHSMQCMGKDHIEIDMAKHQWHLKALYPDHPCTMCHAEQGLCMKCHTKKSCVGCHSFYCDDCEPYPDVLSRVFELTVETPDRMP